MWNYRHSSQYLVWSEHPKTFFFDEPIVGVAPPPPVPLSSTPHSPWPTCSKSIPATKSDKRFASHPVLALVVLFLTLPQAKTTGKQTANTHFMDHLH